MTYCFDKINGFCEGEIFTCTICKLEILIKNTDLMRGDRHDCAICEYPICDNCCCDEECVQCGERELCKNCAVKCIDCEAIICKSPDCIDYIESCTKCNKYYCSECIHTCKNIESN